MSFEIRLTLTIIAVVALAGAVVLLDGQALVLRLFDWLERLGPWAVPLFILADMLVVILILPGVMLTMGAGFLFGVPQGAAYVVIATSTGGAIAFFIARRLLSERWVAYLRNHPKLSRVEHGFTREGWKFVLLTRLIPFFPFKLSNYFFGVTGVSFRHFYFANLIGIVPFTVTNVYLGSIAADLATLGAAPVSRSRLEWLVYGIGFVVAVAALIYFTRLARKALAERDGKGRKRSLAGR